MYYSKLGLKGGQGYKNLEDGGGGGTEDYIHIIIIQL